MPGDSPDQRKGQQGIVPAALFGLCPRCGARGVFAAPARLADECRSCGLDFLGLERGGRFVGIITMLLALILIVAALGIDTWLRPPLWLSLAVWLPLTVVSVIACLRLYKITWLYHAFDERGA